MGKKPETLKEDGEGVKKEAKKKRERDPSETCKRYLSNARIIILKISAACVLFFCCSYFFFQHYDMFWRDLNSYMWFMPVIYFAGLIGVCAYIFLLVGTLESNRLERGDRFDIPYRIIFSITFLALVIRSFLGDFMNPDTDISTNLNVPVPIICLTIASGLLTVCLPKIRDNDTSDF